MKKTYISPAIEILDGAVCQILLAGSTLGIGDPGSADKAEAPLFYDDDMEEE